MWATQAQLGVAVLVTGVGAIAYYLPTLVIGGLVAGILIGLAGAMVIKRVNIVYTLFIKHITTIVKLENKRVLNRNLYFKEVGAYMKVYDSSMLRNISVLGHSGCGKTNLIEAISYNSNLTNKISKHNDKINMTYL